MNAGRWIAQDRGSERPAPRMPAPADEYADLAAESAPRPKPTVRYPIFDRLSACEIQCLFEFRSTLPVYQFPSHQ